jgi:4'-phosphopantetheinyl transferase
MQTALTTRQTGIPGRYLLRSLGHYSGEAERMSEWASGREVAICQRLATPKRRQDWLLGRLTAKELLQKYFLDQGGYVPFRDIEILNEPGGRPYFQVAGEGLDKGLLTLSISHSQRTAVCAISQVEAGENMGVDLEYIAPRPPLFVDTFMAQAEIEQLAGYTGTRYWQAVTAMWSLKEAFLKACGEGLRVDTRKVVVSLTPPPWIFWQMQTIRSDLGEATAWMRCEGEFVLSWAMTKDKDVVWNRQ